MEVVAPVELEQKDLLQLLVQACEAVGLQAL